MADGFGLDTYSVRDLEAVFEGLKKLRVAAGDFAETNEQGHLKGPK